MLSPQKLLLKALPNVVFIGCLLLSSCNTKPNKIKIVVIGDVQPQSDLKSYSEKNWKEQSIDTAQFNQLFRDIIKKEEPDYIFQMGDWVNYNDNLSLKIVDTLGQVIDNLTMPYSEWNLLNGQIPNYLKTKFFMTMGNHESYDEVKITGTYHPDYDILGDISSNIKLQEIEKGKSSLIHQFPHLAAADFKGNTATYFVSNNHFSLLSIDGLDKDRKGLLDFAKDKLKQHSNSRKPFFVMSHYPLFTGLEKTEDSTLVFADIRADLIQLFDEYDVDYYFNGHEHFYLRYTNEEQKALFPEPYPQSAIYITVSDFANPYSREIKRRDSMGVIQPQNYFEGTHYISIEIIDGISSLKVFGYDEDKNHWQIIDEF